MLDALILRMTGPQERSGDAPERRYGYVNFQDVVAAIGLAVSPVTDSINRLEGTLRSEIQFQTAALSRRLDDHERDSEVRDRRIADLEKWKNDIRVERAEREGFRRTVIRGVIWVFEHPAVLLALLLGIASIVTGTVWALSSSGTPVVQVQP